MNIARRDKRHTNDKINGERETADCERAEESARRGEGRRESACKGYGERIPSSLLGMQDGQSALYIPHPSSRPPKDVWASARVDRSVPNRSSVVFKASAG